VSPEQSAPEFEREKWSADHELRKREIAIKEREASRWSWSTPLVALGAAVIGAAVGAGGNAYVAWLNGQQATVLEESKAEAARILEMIKTGDPEKAADNLKFLVDAGLISDADRRKNIQNFLAHRPAGKGPALPVMVWGSAQWGGTSFEDRINTLRQRLKEDNLTAQERDKLTAELTFLEGILSGLKQATPK